VGITAMILCCRDVSPCMQSLGFTRTKLLWKVAKNKSSSFIFSCIHVPVFRDTVKSRALGYDILS
jgi:hypothetical protein